MSAAQNSPITLAATTSIPANGYIELNDPTKLVNPFKTAMFLDEIRFRLANFNGAGTAPLHMVMRCELRLGRNPLTNGAVPIGSFGRALIDSFSPPMIPNVDAITWRLPKPLYIPEGEFVVPKFYNKQLSSQLGAVQMEIVYAGRSLPSNYPVPPAISVPWVTHFETSVMPLTAGTTVVENSTENHIVNPFDENMTVQRFIGRSGFYRTDLGVPIGGEIVDFTTMVRAVDGAGRILVRDPTPFSDVFNVLDRSWTVNTVLAPKKFYLFEVTRSPLVTVANNFQLSAISMVGHRDIPYRSLR